jgi:hypothetical protein
MFFLVFIINIFLFFLLNTHISAFDMNYDGYIKTGSQYIFDSPSLHKDFDSELNVHLGLGGNILKKNEWALDYQIETDASQVDGASVQSNLRPATDIDLHRTWIRLSNDFFQFRGGRQEILFGDAVIFQPLGLFDTRDISGVIPESHGVDSIRATWFLSDVSLIETWLVPAKIGTALISGIRIDMLLGEFDTGVVFQYHPKSDLDNFPGYEREMIQMGYHIKGEHEVGFWNESRLDIEMETSSPVQFDTVFGIDYTFEIGKGLHVLIEYFLTAQQRKFTISDLKGQRNYHQIGLSMDQPIDIDIKWQMYSFYDFRDKSFQIIPQIEYSFTDDLFLYFHGKIGGDIDGNKTNGRLYQRTGFFSGTESSMGLTVTNYF